MFSFQQTKYYSLLLALYLGLLAPASVTGVHLHHDDVATSSEAGTDVHDCLEETHQRNSHNCLPETIFEHAFEGARPNSDTIFVPHPGLSVPIPGEEAAEPFTHSGPIRLTQTFLPEFKAPTPGDGIDSHLFARPPPA